MFAEHGVYSRLSSWENLLLAFRKASKGKRGQANVATFEHRLEENLIQLQHELRVHLYRPAAYTNFFIHEPKRRLISASAFRDRVVHHALCNVIESVFEPTFIADSYANRAGKGTHRAIRRCQQFVDRYPFVLQCDIRQFFPSIDHQVLGRALVTRISDPDVLDLIQLVLACGQNVLSDEYDMVYFPDDNLFSINRPRGLPIGNLTSQFWANVYLNQFDHFVKRELGCRAYLRYVDDFLLFARHKAELWAWKYRLEERLMRFRLVIHPGGHPRPVTEGIGFLGFVLFPGRRRLKRRKGINYQRRLKALLAAYSAGDVPGFQVAASLRGWLNHVRFGHCRGLVRDVRRLAPPEILDQL